MAQPVKKILIVGGGTAGWMSAAYLNRAFGPAMNITLVESPRIGRIGVGEATVPTLKTTFEFLGMREEEWMPKCNAAFKSGVKFVNWRKPPPGQTEHVFFHPFFTFPEPPIMVFGRPAHARFHGLSLSDMWQKHWVNGDRSRTFGDAANPLQRLCELNLAPRPIPGSGVPEPNFKYAYHLDADLLAVYLRDLATGRGVIHKEAEVKQVVLDERGFVSKVVTDKGDLEADLFIDCTGFRGLLINQALKEPFISMQKYLLTDAAVAMPARNTPERLRPYTTANAMGDGWIWEIPLYHRDGSGYVYCSQTCSKDDAEKTLRDFHGDRVFDQRANHIKMRVGYNERSWVNNCVAIGLSSCFVEPLESTTIFLIEYQLALLVMNFPDKEFDAARLRFYNKQLWDSYEDLRDFIVMHYTLTDRDDTPFWRAVREAPIPDSLQETLEYWRSGVIVPPQPSRLFGPRNNLAILTGMGFDIEKAPPLLDHIDNSRGDKLLEEIDEERARLAQVMPGHFDYLRSLHGDHKPSPV